jgi:IS6 family transposase
METFRVRDYIVVRSLIKYLLSYRIFVKIMQKRGLNLTHTTIMRWVYQYSPIISEKLKKHLRHFSRGLSKS